MARDPDLSHLAVPGTRISLRATPRAGRERITTDAAGGIRVYVTVPAEGGKANEAVRRLLARHMGIAKSRLRLISGVSARDKVFQVED